jgi:hypothetical protein
MREARRDCSCLAPIDTTRPAARSWQRDAASQVYFSSRRGSSEKMRPAYLSANGPIRMCRIFLSPSVWNFVALYSPCKAPRSSSFPGDNLRKRSRCRSVLRFSFARPAPITRADHSAPMGYHQMPAHQRECDYVTEVHGFRRGSSLAMHCSPVGAVRVLRMKKCVSWGERLG